MRKPLKWKPMLSILVLAVCFFGILNVVAASSESGYSEGKSSISSSAADNSGKELKTYTNDNDNLQTEVLKPYEDDQLNRMSYSEKALVTLLSVFIAVELAGTGVLIVLILKKSKNT